ncbi:MAG: glycosyltransferase [Candidatus Krumholzibacteria bacterium]|nr:glycosyltransferase [Candidatus Krumholzibacteria bacterium]
MTRAGQFPRVEILASTLVTGGAERVIEALVFALPARGLSARVLCLHEPGDVGAGIARRGAPVVSRIARGRRDPFACARLASLFGRDRKAVLLSLDHHDAVFIGSVAARLAGLKHRFLAVHSTGLWGKRSSFSMSDRFVLGSYEGIVALARAHADYLVRREGIEEGKIRIIPNGVDPGRFRPARSEEERGALRSALSIPAARFVVAMVAALRPEKNHGMFLDAAARIKARRNDFLFLAIGGGPEAEKLQRRSRELSLGDAVRFMGRREDIPAILSAADASVLCSHPVVETFPLAVLEAMSSGLPVVASDVGAVREMMSDGEEGRIISPGDVGSLVESLVALADAPETGRRMGIRGRERVLREFTVDGMVGRYAEMFVGAVGK